MTLYNRFTTGERIRKQRLRIGLSQEEMAAKAGRSYKYYQDIERGVCGMSIDTLLNLSSCLNLSLDYMLYGEERRDEHFDELLEEQRTVIELLGECSERKRKYALNLLKIFMKACDGR